MTDIICPLCGKPNPPDLDECMYCQAPLKSGGFIPPSQGEDEISPSLTPSEKAGEVENQASKPGASSDVEQNIPDWLKQTEARFLDQTEDKPEEPSPDELSEQLDSLLTPPPASPRAQENAIDDDWLASLLDEAGVGEPELPSLQEDTPEEMQEELLPEQEPALEIDKEGTGAAVQESTEEEQALPTQPEEKPEWLKNLEATSKIKLEGDLFASEPVQEEAAGDETVEEKPQDQSSLPDWIAKSSSEETPPSPEEPEPPIAPAELPNWLEALRPTETVSPTRPVEDLSGADIVTAGPLVGLRGVISAHPSAIRAQKPPTYSIKLRVTDEQQARVEMMEELLADEEKPKPLPSQPIITTRNIFRLIVAVALLLPMVWMIISGSQQTTTPQPGNIPGVVDFTQQIQVLPSGAPVLMAFDYEAGFSGELNIAITNVLTQLMNKSAYLTLVSTTPSGPALAESMIKNASSSLAGNPGSYSNYANLGYIPGGTMGLLGLATSPKNLLPYSLAGDNVWAGVPLNAIASVKDFSAVIVMTNDPDTARTWIEQIGPQLQEAGTPLLIVTSSQAEPLIRPYYTSTPAQVQGLIAGLAGGVAYGRTVGNIQQNGIWDAFSAGVTISVLIILIGSIAGVVVKMLAASNQKEI
jgi:hypothetical protein